MSDQHRTLPNLPLVGNRFLINLPKPEFFHDTIKEKRIWPAAFLFSICLLIGRECETEQQLPASCICVFCICVFFVFVYLCSHRPGMWDRRTATCCSCTRLHPTKLWPCKEGLFVCLFFSYLFICCFVCLFFGLFFGLLTGNLVTFSWASLQLFQMAAFV